MDYKKLGLKVGLEIHQQLNSGTKLFCRCPIRQNTSSGGSRNENFPIEIRRRLRAVPGELGIVDEAALQEYLKNRSFIYKADSESSCLVEIDEDPPKAMNEKALVLVIKICKLLHCHILDELHVMRKTVVDGSTVSGFQRTVLAGTNGYLEGSFGKIGITTVTLEEDAATPVAKDKNIIEYRLDRLGIPLIELATTPDITSPQMAKEVAEAIGLLLRSVDVVRGIGSIRQDINISISDGARIEIKGFQELDKIPMVVENEVNRQIALLEIRDDLKKRGFKEIKNSSRDVTKIFSETKSNFIKKVIDGHGFVYALLMPKFAGLLRKQCGDRTFGKELAAYAESYGLGIMHSDEEVARYGLDFEFRKLREEMNAGDEDLIMITAGSDEKRIRDAFLLMVSRANQCVNGVPKETRAADGAGSKYARPLPGSGRLYPESDIQPILITKELRATETPRTLVEQQEETVNNLIRGGMKETLAKTLITYRNVNTDEVKQIIELSKIYKKVDVNTIAKMIIEIPKEIKKRFNLDPEIKKESQQAVLAYLNDGKIPEDAVIYILVDHLTGKPIEEAIGKYAVLTDAELKKIIKDTIAENSGKKESVLMGLVMQKIRGRAPGEKISKMLREMM
jgi:glutamyl-tRNA(Gln) amidotransferase subunit E